MTLNFDCVFYYVSDLDRSIEFYSEVLGLKLHSRDAIARFLVDGVMLELVPTLKRDRFTGEGNARLCLRVNEIQAFCAELEAKGVPCAPIRDEGTGLLSFIHDFDGNEICLWQESRSHQQREHEIWV